MNATRPRSVAEIRDLLVPELRAHNVRKAIVYGSFARGTQTRRSDVDLALVIDTDSRFLDRYDHVAFVQDCLGDLPAEILVYKPGELERISHRPFVKQMLAEGIVIYEQ